MQVVTSISLATCGSRFKPVPGMAPPRPEMRTISRLAWLMAPPSGLLDLDQEPLELGGVGVGIEDGGRQAVGERPLVPPLVLGDAAVALMDGDADLIDLPAVDPDR